MNKPRLSICIATYNRADYIGETLESIIPQVTDEVEIVIVDGASTDSTGSIVKSYSEVCNQIHYVRLPSKGGVDQDYDQAVELAQGEYCWLFTDDDVIKDGAIEKVLLEMAQGYSLIIVNSEVWNRDFSKIIFEKHLSDEVHAIYESDKFDDFFQDCIKYLSFIGGVVIKRNLWKERDRKSYFGTEFIHIGVIFQKLLPTAIRVIADPLIKIRYGKMQNKTLLQRNHGAIYDRYLFPAVCQHITVQFFRNLFLIIPLLIHGGFLPGAYLCFLLQ
jgi:glycosyltransferase involved in cell wall biosynthesis